MVFVRNPERERQRLTRAEGFRGGTSPTNAYGEGSFVPVSTRYDGHFTMRIGARPIEYFVRVAMLSGIEVMRMSLRRAITAMGVWCGHD